jgi:hypothetical protein
MFIGRRSHLGCWHIRINSVIFLNRLLIKTLRLIRTHITLSDNSLNKWGRHSLMLLFYSERFLSRWGRANLLSSFNSSWNYLPLILLKHHFDLHYFEAKEWDWMHDFSSSYGFYSLTRLYCCLVKLAVMQTRQRLVFNVSLSWNLNTYCDSHELGPLRRRYHFILTIKNITIKEEGFWGFGSNT